MDCRAANRVSFVVECGLASKKRKDRRAVMLWGYCSYRTIVEGMRRSKAIGVATGEGYIVP